MNKPSVGFALCGSFCTFSKAKQSIISLIEKGYDVTPILSFNARKINTRFANADEFAKELESICGKAVIDTIEGAEPIGPKFMFDVVVVAPCTGNTLGKLAAGITDTPVTMAVKSHIRNGNPVCIAVSTNDALGAASKNIGQLLNYKHIFFVPFSQDNYKEKPNSMVADFDMIEPAVLSALENKQIQPVLQPFSKT